MTTITPTATLLLAGQPNLNNARTEVAFVLDNVADWQTLAAGVRPGVEVVVLDSRGDGLAQMADWLAQKTPGSVDTLHLLGHGSSGAIDLGGLTLNSQNLQDSVPVLSTIGRVLKANGDILVYGCNIGEGEAGQSFVEALGQATNADIAASNDLTGASTLGGNWDLEIAHGQIESSALISFEWTRYYSNVLVSTGTTNGTYDFAGSVGVANSGGPGFKTYADKFVVSNIFVQAQTGIPLHNALYANNSTVGASETVVIKAENGSTCKTFTFEDLGLSCYAGTQTFTSLGLVLKGISGNTIASLNQSGPNTLTTSIKQLSTMSWGSTFSSSGWGSVASIEITYSLSADDPSEINFEDITLSNITAATAPTATIVVADTALKVGETSGVTFTFSEAVSGFDNADLTIANGTLSAVSSSDGGITWAATFTPTAGVTDASNIISVNMAGVSSFATSTAGSGSTNSNNYTIDTQRPTASIALDDTALRVGETATVTFTFSEAVTGFTNADLTIANGTLSAVSTGDGGTTWTATFTPSASTTDATNVITLDNTGVTDAAGNAGSGTTDSNNYAIDTTAPTLDAANSSPADDATNVALGSDIVIDFSENIAFGSSGTIELRNVTDNSTAASFTVLTGIVTVNTGGTATINADKLTINPTADLTAGKTYAVQIGVGGISLTDTAGNALASITNNTTYNFSTIPANAAPTLTSFAAPVATALEDTQREITLANLKDQGNEADSDGTVDAFVVQAVSTGTLKIGTSAVAATAWDAATNNTVDTTHHAYWTPAGNVSGSGLNAFTVKAKDNAGAVSATAVQVTLNVTEVNDAPTLTANGSTPTFTEDGSAVTLFSNTNASTQETGQTLSGLTLTVTNVSDTTERLGIDGSTINLTNGGSGTTTTNGFAYSVSVTGGTATVTLNKAAGISTAAMQTLVNGIIYSNTSQAPGTASTRVVTLTAIQDNGGTANGGADTGTPGGAGPATVTVVAVNDAPTIDLNATTSGNDHNTAYVAGGSAVTIGNSDATLADVDSANLASLTVTLTNRPDGDGAESLSLNSTAQTAATNAGLTVGYTAATGVLSITGSAAPSVYQTILRGVTYSNTDSAANATVGARTVTVVANDGAEPAVQRTSTVTVSVPPPPDPASAPAPAPAPPPAPPTDTDNDGVAAEKEDTAPGLPQPGGQPAVVGDGNGDGIKDSQQASVTSTTFLLSTIAETKPTGASPIPVTLVADSLGGKTDPDAGNASITSIVQKNAPADMPPGMNAPLGLIGFTATIDTQGSKETFSLYVDAKLGVNGYWKKDINGTWFNLASEAFGGKMVEEGGKLRLDFVIQDGGQFDSDGSVPNGTISDPGAAGFMAQSITEYHPKVPTVDHFWF